MIDPKMLIDPSETGMPAPVWFVQFFKALGFTLHTVPMNLWYAGLLVALWLHLRGSGSGRRFAGRLLQQMPIIVAFGINFGIVPLLFIQLAYYKVFYPATILMAYFWLAIIVLLIPAYYGIYAYAWGLHSSRAQPDAASENGTAPLASAGDSAPKALARWRRMAGWFAALLFLCISFIFANGMSLLEHVGRWPALWNDHSIAAAATGWAWNVGDAVFFPRWFLMFGLALGTTAVWALVDAVFLTRGTTDEAYERWAWGFAKKLYTVGLIWAALAGLVYIFTWDHDLRAAMFSWPLWLLTIATGLAPGLPWLLITTAGQRWGKRMTVAAIALAQFGVLAINAVSRQVAQNVSLKPFIDVSTQPTDVQWGPLAMFLIAFVIGVVVVAWMLAQIVKCKPNKAH